MNSVDVELGEQVPERYFADLLARLGGDWHVEAAREAWRGERLVDGFLWTVSLERPAGHWVVAWRAEANVPHAWGLGLMLACLAAAVVVLLVAEVTGHRGPLALLTAVVTIAAGLGLGRRVLATRLPSVDAPTAALREAVHTALATA
ncbi:MAG: hypothetical protein H6735_18630 [Alphaproteobacteria bacterium]|nr:hypothetical protein [Alphaproteobacteria bacterium]